MCVSSHMAKGFSKVYLVVELLSQIYYLMPILLPK